ncbi:hypothetical protein NDU88_002256 [Pleurodeles waltl]|uniref:Uncharacterized protein n=1 Tax=Pleurodeles waltl TaxID=8319 RepID=A0AAV7W054_PLEWA|nr:hypothetical protein NDU88_002256 [Pleurodeles waltl]
MESSGSLDNQAPAEALGPNTLGNMLASLTDKINKGFAISEANQGEIRLACELLEKNIDLLGIRTQALEESVGAIKGELSRNKEEIQLLKENESEFQEKLERDFQEKLEHLENSSRRNNLRLLSVSEGVEGADLKKYVVSLIKWAMALDKTEVEIMKDIQRIHRDPFQRNPNNKKPQKILVNFQTYMLK